MEQWRSLPCQPLLRIPYNVNYLAGLASQGIAPDQGKAVAEIRADWNFGNHVG